MDTLFYPLAVKAVPLLLIVVVIVCAILRHRRARLYQSRGVQLLLVLRLLITHIQRHRGLASGVLGGQRSLIPLLNEMRARATDDIGHISTISPWLDQSEEWLNIIQHWARLSGNVLRLSTQQSTDQHTRLITNILLLVDKAAGAHFLHQLPGRSTSIWRELLTLAELVGQIRAAAMALAASLDQQPDPDYVLCRRLDSVIKEAYRLLETPYYAAEMEAQLLQQIIDFLNSMDRLLLREQSGVTATDVYQTATGILDAIYERFDAELASIQRRLGI